jgi:hypothetical protein
MTEGNIHEPSALAGISYELNFEASMEGRKVKAHVTGDYLQLQGFTPQEFADLLFILGVSIELTAKRIVKEEESHANP